MNPVVLITGASTGIGKATAHYLCQQGYRVYGTSRHATPQGSLEPAGFTLIQMDVTDDASVTRSIGLIVERGGVDIEPDEFYAPMSTFTEMP
jgi:NADP-dependent 3-hydroxy acid dehydrogenase YdfG